MSANLYWRPERPPDGSDLSDALKFKLRERYDLMSGPYVLDRQRDYDYLEGLHDGGVEDADVLLKALRKHEKVRIELRS